MTLPFRKCQTLFRRFRYGSHIIFARYYVHHLHFLIEIIDGETQAINDGEPMSAAYRILIFYEARHNEFLERG